MKNPIPFLRRIAIIEGVSFLLLLCIAMPLKYLASMPLPVTIVGWLHGLLFVIFCCSLLHTMTLARWPVVRGVIVFIASLLPFGPFVLDRKMRQWEAEAANIH